jgi:hypothetical protein
MSSSTGQPSTSPSKKPSSSNFLFGKAEKPPSNPTLLPDFGLKKAEELSSSAFLLGNPNLPTSDPRPLPDFGFQKAKEPLSGAFPLGNANQPLTTSNPSSLPNFGLGNRSLRDDLNTVAKLLKRWSHYPFLVSQAVNAEKIDVKELFECASAIVEDKDKIVLTFVQGIIADK